MQFWEFNVELVSTLPDTVRVLRVETNAYVIRARDPDLIGKLTYQFQSLPFGSRSTLYDPAPPFPGAVILQPRDGDRVMNVKMQSQCLPGIALTSGAAGIDVYLTVYVWTTAGLVTSLPLQIKHG